MDKRTIVSALKERLASDIAESTRLAKDAAAAASHEENKPENDKDMRSTEASYVARGQAERVRALEQALVALGSMPVRDFADGEPIQSSALVDVSTNGRRTRYLLVPSAGGMTLDLASAGDVGDVVHTLAATSPLGRALLGLSEGDEVEVDTPQGTRTSVILRVR